MRRLPSFGVSMRAWREANELADIPRLRLWIVACLGAGVGLTESLFLAILASVGVAIAGQGDAAVKIPFGSIEGVSTPTLLIVGAFLAIVTVGAQYFIQVQLARVNSRTVAELRTEIMREFMHADWRTQRGEIESTLVNYMAFHVPRVANLVTAIVSQLTASITLLVFIVASIAISPLIATAVVILGSVLYFGFRPVRRIARRAGEETKDSTNTLYHNFIDTVNASRDIKAYGVEAQVHQRVADEIQRLERPAFRLRLVQGFVPVLYQRFVFLILLGGLGLVYALDVTDIAAIGASMLIVLRAMQQAQVVQTAEPVIAESLPWIAELKEGRERYRASTPQYGTEHLAQVDEIAFAGVSYRYPGENAALALDNVNFVARRGELVGVIGPSGSGKSTMSELLVRLDRPTSGTFRVNGRDASDYDNESWTRQVALVPQLSHLIAGTVEENIQFLRADVPSGEVRHAARLSHLSEDVAEMEDGFATMVGERGHRGLSGGQRQRVSIARGVVGKPSLIVLDEPTSALDHKAEDVIVETIEALRGHACVVVIAHRLSTLRHCDRVLVLRDGKVEAYCPVDELAKSSEFFRDAGVAIGQ